LSSAMSYVTTKCRLMGPSPGCDSDVLRNVSPQPTGQQPCLKAHHDSPRTPILEQRVGDELVEAGFIGADERLSAPVGEDARGLGAREITVLDHSSVDRGDHGAVHDQ